MHLYALALGSNRHRGVGKGPAASIESAIRALAGIGRVVARSRTIMTPALGPAGRSFANAAILLEAALDPPALLARLKQLERAMGRRPGRRWGARVIDVDIVLWSGGIWRSRDLTIPHAAAEGRDFVLRPLGQIAADWRVAPGASTVRHLAARLTRRPPVHRSRRRSGP